MHAGGLKRKAFSGADDSSERMEATKRRKDSTKVTREADAFGRTRAATARLKKSPDSTSESLAAEAAEPRSAARRK
jgi:hypothetical protein